jgi:hypothetical protein
VEKIGIKNAGAIGKFDEIGSDVEGTPDEKIREKKGDVKEIAEIFVGRKNVNEEGEDSKKEEE